MNKPQKEMGEDLIDLQQQHWVNNHTRAIFLEFSVYNPQVNLFGICTFIAEFIPGGGIIPYWRIEPVRLLHHHQAGGTFNLICEIAFCLYIVYFIVKQLAEMKKQKGQYWKSYWTLAEWSVIGLSLMAVGLYSYRYTAILDSKLFMTITIEHFSEEINICIKVFKQNKLGEIWTINMYIH